jgi:hypothetical protein
MLERSNVHLHASTSESTGQISMNFNALKSTANTVGRFQFSFVSAGFLYESRLQSSWTQLITTSWNFVEVPPLASDALLTTLYPHLENVLQTINHFEIFCFGAPSSLLEKPRNRMGGGGRDLDYMTDVLMGFHRPTFSKPNIEFNSDLASCDFWAFPTTKKEL